MNSYILGILGYAAGMALSSAGHVPEALVVFGAMLLAIIATASGSPRARH
jgi:hypothetical protein